MWTHKSGEFTEEMIGDSVGFVYCIINNKTARRYIGKKLFTFAKTKQVKGKKKKSRVKSDWMTYYGSNKELQADVLTYGTENFSRIILVLCNTRGSASYWETYYILQTHALLNPDLFYNAWVSCKINKSHLKIDRSDVFFSHQRKKSEMVY